MADRKKPVRHVVQNYVKKSGVRVRSHQKGHGAPTVKAKKPDPKYLTPKKYVFAEISPRPKKVYNSHGYWSTLGKVNELEKERENEYIPRNVLPDSTPAIWITLDPQKALRYSFGGGDWDRIDSGDLNEGEKEVLEDIKSRAIPVTKTSLFALYDGDGGYLMIDPEHKE